MMRHYKPHSTVNAQTIAENVAARRYLPGPQPEAEIVFMPESAVFATDLLGMEPDQVLGLDRVTRVKAWVAEGRLFNTVGGLGVVQLPPGHHFKVFAEMDAAMAWVKELLGGKSRQA